MPTTFSRSMRALHGDGYTRINRLLLLSILFLTIWTLWFFLSEVTIYESTDVARIEVERASYPLQAAVSGKVVVNRLSLGKEVRAGDILVELETETERRRLDELRAHRLGLARQITALRGEMASRRKGRSEQRSAGTSATEQARALYNEAESSARFSESQADRMEKLAESGNVSEIELQRFQSEAQSKRSAAEARRIELVRIEKEQRTDGTDRQIDMERLNHDIVLLEGETATTDASMRQIEQEIERRLIRAEGNGKVGEVAEIAPGSVIREGDRLGAIVPGGALRVVASFPPPAVFGRIRAGQRGLMRIAGFPWTQYGGVRMIVESVGSEVRDGSVRVELAIDQDDSTTIPLQHGLPGSVEIEIERVTPATLLLRTAGKLLDSPARETPHAVP